MKKYFVPDIKIVGYGRTQTFQIVCAKCGSLFFNHSLPADRRIADLFCDNCVRRWAYPSNLKDDNYSQSPVVGNIVGWVIKTTESNKRSRYNYNKVYKRDGYICQYCNYNPRTCAEFRILHIDHIIPFTFRGSNSLDNMVVACDTCNLIASNMVFRNFTEKQAYIESELYKRKLLPLTLLSPEVQNQDKNAATGL